MGDKQQEKEVKRVAKLVKKKLEEYLNEEKRELRFDCQGVQTTTKYMHQYDFAYKVLEATKIDHKSPRAKKNKAETRDNSQKSSRSSGGAHKDTTSSKIDPKLNKTSRRVTLHKEADRLAQYANDIFTSLPVEQLAVIHRYRPHCTSVQKSAETGCLQNYNRHVGAALHQQTYAQYYTREGLQTGNPKKAERLKKLAMVNMIKPEDSDKEDQNDKAKGADNKKPNKSPRQGSKTARSSIQQDQPNRVEQKKSGPNQDHTKHTAKAVTPRLTSESGRKPAGQEDNYTSGYPLIEYLEAYSSSHDYSDEDTEEMQDWGNHSDREVPLHWGQDVDTQESDGSEEDEILYDKDKEEREVERPGTVLSRRSSLEQWNGDRPGSRMSHTSISSGERPASARSRIKTVDTFSFNDEITRNASGRASNHDNQTDGTPNRKISKESNDYNYSDDFEVESKKNVSIASESQTSFGQQIVMSNSKSPTEDGERESSPRPGSGRAQRENEENMSWASNGRPQSDTKEFGSKLSISSKKSDATASRSSFNEKEDRSNKSTLSTDDTSVNPGKGNSSHVSLNEGSIGNGSRASVKDDDQISIRTYATVEYAEDSHQRTHEID